MFLYPNVSVTRRLFQFCRSFYSFVALLTNGMLHGSGLYPESLHQPEPTTDWSTLVSGLRAAVKKGAVHLPLPPRNIEVYLIVSFVTDEVMNDTAVRYFFNVGALVYVRR